MNLKILLAFLAPTLLLSPFGFAKTRALLVGIDRYESRLPSLRGCVNDTNRFADVLNRKCGVPGNSILRLTNERATQSAIVRAIETHLIAGVNPEDTVIFYFSGHGTHTPDLNGDEPDDVDEALCPHDIDPKRPGTWLTDDMIGQLLDRIPAANVLVVLDCCHSGTGTRENPPEFSITRGANLGFQPRPGADEAAQQFDPDASHILLAAAGASQLANEVSPVSSDRLGLPEKEFGGLFTHVLCDIIRKNPDISFADLKTALGPKTWELSKQLTRINFKASVQDPHFLIPKAVHPLNFGTFVRSGAHPAPAETARQESKPEGEPQGGIWGSLFGRLGAGGKKGINVELTDSGVITSGDVKLQLGTDQPIYREGEQMTVTVEADRDCYLRLYYKSAEGRVSQIFPNAGRRDNQIRAKTSVTLPGAGDRFRFTIEPPFGSEILMAVASTVQFEDLKDKAWTAGLFDNIPDTNLATVSTRGTRGIRVDVDQPEPLFGAATLIYEAWPEE